MDGARTYLRTQVVLGRLERVNRAARRPKALFLLYFEKTPLIQLTRSGPLSAWSNFERFTWLVLDNTSWCWMAGSMIV